MTKPGHELGFERRWIQRDAGRLPEQVMKHLVYFDTDAFRHFAATFHEHALPPDLCDKILLSPITMLEVISQMAEPCAEEIHKHMKGLPNWLNREDTHLLGWPDEVISEMIFGNPPKDDVFLHAVEGFINQCLTGTPTDLFESARQLQDEIRKFKGARANNFLPLVNLCRQDQKLIDNFDEEWLKCVIPGLKQSLKQGTSKEKLLEALSAYHEFEREELKLAMANDDYKPQKHQNDALDSQQSAYLCNQTLHFVACDKGYLNKIKKSPQKSRIHQTSVQTLSDSAKAEELLTQIIG